ncbi:MAG: hypothetical protein IT442_04230 [Phycisphaeraceae bacterium]|nr:hypothetical protein [Phycisphaeraceae bacterium]
MSSPPFTPWHITFGTYGSRLHGSDLPTVDRRRNQVGQPFEPSDPPRQNAERSRLTTPPVYLTPPQRRLIESQLPLLCQRGRWLYRLAAAQPDHIHIILDIPTDIHGHQVRQLLKRWLTQLLTADFPSSPPREPRRPRRGPPESPHSPQNSLPMASLPPRAGGPRVAPPARSTTNDT